MDIFPKQGAALVSIGFSGKAEEQTMPLSPAGFGSRAAQPWLQPVASEETVLAGKVHVRTWL